MEISTPLDCAPALVGPLPHRNSRAAQIRWGDRVVYVDGDASVCMRSMMNTDMPDAIGTAIQVKKLARASSELVRIAVDTPAAAVAVPAIREQLDRMGVDVPLVGDFHYNGRKLLQDYPECAQALSKYRINPGNVGQGAKRDTQFAQMIEIACHYDRSVRTGVNWGSLDQDLLTRVMDENARHATPWDARAVVVEALITSAIQSAQKVKELDLPGSQVTLSCEVSVVQDLIAVYRELARRYNYALHLGLTEAGTGGKGIIASTAALSVLLQEDIGDMTRISLTPEPDTSREKEVIVAQGVLQTMGLCNFTPMVIACSGCRRTINTVFQELTARIQSYLREQMPVWKEQYPGVEEMSVAVMGCIVNGPGESKHANISISLPGTGKSPAASVFVDGVKVKTLRGERITEESQAIVDEYVRTHYGAQTPTAV